MVSFFQELPKAELHLHLEGSVEPETLRELAPELTLEEIRDRYRYDDFLGFLRSYKWVNDHLRGPGEYALITRRLLERLAGENVRYVELNLSVGVILWKRQDLAPVFDAVRTEAERSPVVVRWIFDAVRQFDVEDAMHVADLAAARREEGVVALGLGGDEARGPVERFSGVLKRARDRGLRLAIHGGETTGPESVWGALRLGADRIGHGIRSIEDPALVEHLAVHRIPLEICLSSNVSTGAVASLEEHPIRRLYEAGVPIVLNTDDPAMFHTTLTAEYELAAHRFGFTQDELRGLAENGFRYAFDAGGAET